MLSSKRSSERIGETVSELISCYIRQGVAHNKTIAKVGRNTYVSEPREILTPKISISCVQHGENQMHK